jgi:hypothetical protein
MVDRMSGVSESVEGIFGGFSYVKEVGREVTPLRSVRKLIEKTEIIGKEKKSQMRVGEDVEHPKSPNYQNIIVTIPFLLSISRLCLLKFRLCSCGVR